MDFKFPLSLSVRELDINLFDLFDTFDLNFTTKINTDNDSVPSYTAIVCCCKSYFIELT